VRQQAVEGILERNPNAFRPKIQTDGDAALSSDGVRHCKGCNCKKSAWLDGAVGVGGVGGWLVGWGHAAGGELCGGWI